MPPHPGGGGRQTLRQELRVAGASLWPWRRRAYTVWPARCGWTAPWWTRSPRPSASAAYTSDAEHGLRLNGEPLKLKGGCIHHDNGLLGAATYDRAEERKVEMIKAAGFNAIRCAHNPPAPAMLDACDRLGMLVIDETFDCWRRQEPQGLSPRFKDWWRRDLAA